MKKTAVLTFAAILVSGTLTMAQEQGKVGIIMRVDPAPRIGLTYHLSKAFALRPYVGFSMSSQEAENEFIPLNQEGLPDPRVITSERKEDSTRVTAAPPMSTKTPWRRHGRRAVGASPTPASA